MDDIVINTEIDRLIDLLSQRKRVEVDELVKELGADKKKIKKWLLVLEDEGYLKLEYRLTRMFAVWQLDLGPSTHGLPHVGEEQVKEGAEAAIGALEEEAAEAAKPAEHGRHKRATELANENRRVGKGTSQKAGLAGMGKQADECVEEAEVLKRSIQELKEKEKRLEAELPSIERYAAEKAGSITERISYLQHRIVDLKKSLGKAGGLASNIAKRGRLAKSLLDEAGSIYSRIDSMLGNIKEAAKSKTREIGKGIAELEMEAMQEEEQVSVLEKTRTMVEKARNGVANSAAGIRETVSELNGQLEEAETALASLDEKKDALGERIANARRHVSARKGEIEALRGEVEETAKLEEKLDKYMETYKKEADEIRVLVTRAEAEIREMEEKASASALEVYSSELEKTSGSVEARMKEISEGKAKVAAEMAKKKARLKEIAGKGKPKKR
jgi:chromosome segregation ATPase